DDGDQSEDDEDTATVVPAQSDLSIVKGVVNATSVLPANIGDVLTFELIVTNDGPNNATGVAIEDIVPSGYTNISAIDNGGSATSNIINWNGLSITNGTSLTLTYQVTVGAPTGTVGEYQNVAQVTASDQFDPDSSVNNDDGDQDEDD
ncbi:DUF11 domain-containing protein, partial [Kordia jejudonensis]|uniref:DUF11 domain-containing protein n=1 Tax=Kordia jejudonensis TaxID=1348245 RepID=UPI000629513F